MKVGIDRFCCHRFFGEVYSQQRRPAKRMVLEDFIDRAKALGGDGVSPESCFIPRKDDTGYLESVKARLDEYAFDRVYAWGHPDGLEGGRNPAEYADLIGALGHARRIGAPVMRIVCSSLRFRFEDHREQIRRRVLGLREAVRIAADHGTKPAIGSHVDFTA